MELRKIVANSIQRMPIITGLERASVPHRVVRRLSQLAYKFVFLHARDRHKVNAVYWGGDGGFLHAKARFQKEDWQKGYGQFADAVREHLSPGRRVLELGCSAGQWCERLGLVELGCTYHGVDINPQTIHFAREHFAGQSGVSFEAADLIDFDAYDGYDLVIACQTLFFLDRATLLGVLKRIKPGCLLIFQEPVNSDFATQKRTQAMRYKLTQTSTGFSHNYPALLQELGFETLQMKASGAGGPRKRLLVMSRKLLHYSRGQMA
jgi:2-polyprenyl-3-methyl-5-hydroxy-6-metoxy-1,4-benzoquinol methylase